MGQSDPLQTQAESSTNQTLPLPMAVAASAYRGTGRTVGRGYRGVVNLLAPVLAAYGFYTDSERNDATRALLLAMGLPLIDGVFPALVLGGALDSIPGLLVVGGTIFGGPWMLTIIFEEMAGDDRRTRLIRVLKVAVLVVPAAGLEAVAAPTLASLLDMNVFHVFSALIILTVGASIANDLLAAKLVAPKYLLAAGLVASVMARVLAPAPITPTVMVEPGVVAQAMGAAAIATTLALTGAVLGPRVDSHLDDAAFRTGAGIALALVPLSIAGVLPSLSSLAVFALAIVAAIDDPEADDAAAAAGDE
ncbi:DUF5794 domain-containing protein [Haloarchaeobius sp. DYHT-AS-18]|uniref:DUF5794 domain-containing protein n=1 Tax=Haloarchaeobius sp. DYHT-AS-18 TaxID=3446117 RepID=UPI003EBB4263